MMSALVKKVNNPSYSICDDVLGGFAPAARASPAL
jgi:hypothetical protein